MSILALCLSVAFAASAQIKVSVPGVVSVGETFNLQFMVEDQKPSDFNWPGVEGLEIVWGPQTGSSSSISIVNGKTTKSSSYTYTYVLTASAEGQYTIPSATASVKGGKITSKQVAIKVVKGSASQQSQASSGSGSAQTRSAGVSSDDIFLRLNLNRRNVVLGESITAELKLYQRVSIAGFEDVHFPSFTGFWSQETFSASQVEFHREAIGDEVYNVALLRSYELIPQQTGDLLIDPAEIVCLVNVRTQRAPQSIFDSFFQDDYSTLRKRVATPSQTVHVSALPQPQPASFCGGVGRFTFDAALTRDSIAAHDAASLIIKVGGKGNLSLIEAPKVHFPADFDTYDVKVSEKDGKRVFEYPFIPRSHGSFDIDGLDFTYYDTASKAYRTLSAGPLHIDVSRTETGEAAPAGIQSFAGVSARDIRDIGSDIRYIATAEPSKWKRGDSFFVFSPLFFGLAALLLVIAAAVCLIVGKLRRNRSDVAGTRKKGASKMARTRLAKAGEYMKAGLYGAFYEELHRALLGFAADRFSLDASQLDKDTIREKLAGGPADDYVALLDACEFARYSPSNDSALMEEHYRSALELFSQIGSNMKSSSKGRSAIIAAVLMAGALQFVTVPDARADEIEALPAELAVSGRSAEPGTLSTGQAVSGRSSLWNEALEAYADGDWTGARQAWETIAASGENSAALQYNIGCACFKMREYAWAVVGFERALRLDPGYKDAAVNLEFTKAFLQDRIDSVPEFFLKTWMRRLRAVMGSDAWAVLALVLFALCLAGIVLFILSRSSAARKGGFFSALVALLLGVMALCLSASARNELLAADRAIVVSPVSVVRSAPDSATGTDLFVLHEGAPLQIRDRVGKWYNVTLPDGRQGWIQDSEIEVL